MQLKDARPNVPIDAARFAKPDSSARSSVPETPAAAAGMSLREAVRHAGTREDGTCDRVTLGSRLLAHALNLADPHSRRACSSLTRVGMALVR